MVKKGYITYNISDYKKYCTLHNIHYTTKYNERHNVFTDIDDKI